MIPTVGRILLFTPPVTDLAKREGDGRLAAIVSHVHADGKVNVGVFDSNGHPIEGGYRHVPIVADGEPKPDGGGYCEWPVVQRPESAPAASAEAADGKPKKPGK